MANTHTTLTSLFTDIAKAIRKAKTGSETGTAIVADNFPTAISGITYRGAVTSSLNAGGSYTIPAGYHNGSGKVTANSLASQTTGTASAGEILSGETAWVGGSKITGTMTNRGAVTKSLIASGSYTIPAGYHNGSGKVTAASLSSQTSATAAASEILSGETAWVNGSKITGSMTNRGAITTTIQPGGSYTIPAGYHNGSGKVTASVGYALSGTWRITASTLHNNYYSSPAITATGLDYELQYGADGVWTGSALKFDTSGLWDGSQILWSGYEYAWMGEVNGNSYPTAYLKFNGAYTVTEEFYNKFISVATQTSSGDDSGSVSTGTLSLQNSVGAGALTLILPVLDQNSISYSQSTPSQGSNTFTNVVRGAPITLVAKYDLGSYPFLVSGSNVSNTTLEDGYMAASGYQGTARTRLTVYTLTLDAGSGSFTVSYDCCFDGTSKVLMADGTTKTLADVAIGDTVMTYNETTGVAEANEVTALGTVDLSYVGEIILEDDTIIRMNSYHPMWTSEGWKSLIGYKGLPFLTQNDKLMNNNGEYLAIKSIEYIDIEKETYYTLKVANNNNFYVNGYLAQGKDKD